MFAIPFAFVFKDSIDMMAEFWKELCYSDLVFTPLSSSAPRVPPACVSMASSPLP